MDVAQIITVLELLGVEDIIQDEAQRAVKSSCPFAIWKHEGCGSTPSLTVKISRPNELPIYTCSVCGTKGVLPDLVNKLQNLSGKQYPKASLLVAEAMKLKGRAGLTRRRIRVDASAPRTPLAMLAPRRTVSDDELDSFPLLEGSELTDAQAVINWLHHDRGIKPKVIFRHKLRLYVDPLIGDLGVALPVINPEDGCICELWAWVVGSEKPHRILTRKTDTITNHRTAAALFGIEYVAKGEPVLMVQNPLGAMKLESLGVAKAVAVLGHLTPENLNIGHVPKLYLAFDDTQTGRDMVRVACKYVNSARTYFLRWSDVRNSRGKHLFSVDDLECLAQFTEIFESRIALVKA